MSYSSNHNALVAELVRIHGSLGTNARGESVPALSASDMMGVLALFARGVIGAIDTAADRICLSQFVSEDGIFLEAMAAIAPSATSTLDTSRYLAGLGLRGAPYKRSTSLSDAELKKVATPGQTSSAITWEPARNPSSVRNEQTEQIYFLRETIQNYQRALDVVTSATFRVSSFSVVPSTTPPTKDQVSQFLGELKALGAALDVHGENPPTSWRQDLAGALTAAGQASKKAVEDGAELAGKALAAAGNEAGKLAGGFLDAFFKEAGLLTLVVAGVVIYKVMP